MTRIFLPLLLFLIPFTSYGQYQLPNPGFENWESNGEPTGFHSFNTATGSLSNFAGNSNQLSQQSDVRPGSSGSSSAKISARNILGNNANGNLTTGQIVAGSMTASSTDNHNKSYPSNTGYNQPFTGKPDAITIWTKYVPSNSGDYARVNAVIHGNSNYQDPENTDYSNIKYAQATLNYQAASGNGWQQLNIPFNVINNNVKPAYILISFSTNKSAGGGSSNDAVYIDDIEFIYNSRLTSLKVGGSDLSGFDKNTYNYTYRVNSLNSLPAITATPDGLGASVSQNITDGTATITVKGNDYSANPANTHTYTVTFMAETNISASDVITAYGTTKDIPVTTNNDQSPIEYTVADPGIAKIENGKIVPLKAGSTTLTLSQKASKNYTAASKTIKISVNKAPLTVTADNATRPYGSANPTFTLSYTGFVNGETEAALAVKPTATCSATSTSPAGTYDITAAGGKSDNYSFSYKKGTLTITSSSVQISISPIGEKKYGDAAFDLQATSPNQETPITYTVADPTVARIDNGRVTILKAGSTTITARQAASANYGEASASTPLVIKKASLTASVNNATRRYGEGNPVFSFSYKGFVNGETEAVLAVKPTATCEATPVSQAGKYDISISGGNDENYDFIYIKGILTVEVSSLELTFSDFGEKSYGDAPFALQVSSPNTETPIVFSIEDGSIARIDNGVVTLLKAGSTTITARQEASVNYGEASATIRLIVKKAPLTIRAENKKRKYGEENPVFTLSYDGLVGKDTENDIPTPGITCEATATAKPGSYPITPASITDERYEISTVVGELTIEKAVLEVTCRNESSIAGNEPVTDFEFYISGFVNGESQSVIDRLPVITCEVTSSSTVGFYPLVISGGEDDCYTFNYTNGTYTVRSATLSQTSITLSPISGKRYGDQPFAPIYSTNNSETEMQFAIGNPEIVAYKNGQLHILKSGTTTLKAYQESGFNFTEGESDEIMLTIEKAPLRVNVKDTVRIEGENNPVFSLTYSGFINGDDASVIDLEPTATCTADISSPGGYYDISVSGGEDDCYEFAQYIGGTLLVKGKTRISIDKISGKRYGDLPFAPVCSTNNDESPVRFEIADTEVARIENGKIVILKGGTTTLKAYQEESALFSDGESEEISFTVEKAPLSVSADNVLRQVGEPNPAFTVSYSGFVNGDDASVIDVVPVAQCLSASISSPAGYYDITVSGGEDDCYTFTRYTSGTLVVTEVSALNAPTLNGVRIYLSDKRLTVKGLQADTVEIYALNGRLAGRYKPGEIVTLPSGFYIAKTETGKACLQITE